MAAVDNSFTALNVLGITSLVAGAILMIVSRIPKQTIANQKDLIASYEGRLKALEDDKKVYQNQHLENIKAIADLQGQIKVYKELPLQDIAQAMKTMTATNEGIAKSNSEILRTLKSSALIAAHDRADLVPDKQVISSQTVQHQTVKK